MSELDDVMAEAEYNALEAEARKNALVTALCVLQWAEQNFDQWRAWADARGLTSGPRTAEILHAHGHVVADLLDEHL